MKKYSYVEPDRRGRTHFIIKSEQQILDTFWEYWKERMIMKYGEGSPLIKEENCIRDWVVTHWADEYD
jgi:hypothetical protein